MTHSPLGYLPPIYSDFTLNNKTFKIKAITGKQIKQNRKTCYCKCFWYLKCLNMNSLNANDPLNSLHAELITEMHWLPVSLSILWVTRKCATGFSNGSYRYQLLCITHLFFCPCKEQLHDPDKSHVSSCDQLMTNLKAVPTIKWAKLLLKQTGFMGE